MLFKTVLLDTHTTPCCIWIRRVHTTRISRNLGEWFTVRAFVRLLGSLVVPFSSIPRGVVVVCSDQTDSQVVVAQKSYENKVLSETS